MQIQNDLNIDARVLDNQWTVEIKGQLKEFSEIQIKFVHWLVLKNMLVVMRDQKFSPEDEIRIAKVVGDPISTLNDKRVDDTTIIPGIIRVTGKKNKNGIVGLFGHRSTLDWHANRCSSPERKPLIWMWGESGMEGSRTSFINNIITYKDLPEDFKNQISEKKVFCGFKTGTYSESVQFKEHINREWAIPLVYTNDAKQTGLYFPFHQILEMQDTNPEDFNKIMNFLKNHVLQEKYMYHHDWKDNDLLISEQWLSIHKRWYFEKMEERILHRIAYDYSNMDLNDTSFRYSTG